MHLLDSAFLSDFERLRVLSGFSCHDAEELYKNLLDTSRLGKIRQKSWALYMNTHAHQCAFQMYFIEYPFEWKMFQMKVAEKNKACFLCTMSYGKGKVHCRKGHEGREGE
jgi:hypothetical protein